MKIQGTFISRRGEPVAISFTTGGDASEVREIGTDEAGIYFTAESPAEITGEANDTFDVLLQRSATVRLLCREFVPQLFGVSARDVSVRIDKGGRCVFSGYVEPQAYSQPYNEVLDELEVSCIDALGALQYRKYKDIGAAGVSYDEVKAAAAVRPLSDILREALSVGGVAPRVWYDGSKAADAEADPYEVFAHIAVSDLLFLGEEEDDVDAYDAVVTEALKYLDLHILQDGADFYVFSWSTIRRGGAIQWRDVFTGDTLTTPAKVVGVTRDNVADTGTNISLGEVYNRLELTCDITDMEGIVESPLDADALESDYPREYYMTEISADGEGERAQNAAKAMILGEDTDFDGARLVKWFARIMRHPRWKFYTLRDNDLSEYYKGMTQAEILNDLQNYRYGDTYAEALRSQIISFGSVTKNMAKTDNSPTSKIDMKTSLVLQVLGNGIVDGKNTFPNPDTLLANCPQAVYAGSSAGGSLSPADGDTTNYLLLKGKIVLNPRMECSQYMAHDGKLSFMNTMPSRNNEDGRFYTRVVFAEDEERNPVLPDFDPEAYRSVYNGGYLFCPFTGEGPQRYEFKYSAIGDRTDTISKVGAVACMLIVGDKCLVETGTQGQPSDFGWRPYKAREEFPDTDEGTDAYFAQSFTIGFDPKIGDKLIGTEFGIQNNVDYRMGLDEEGMAIPIRKSDRVSGAVRFMILGAVNLVWDEVTRRHPTWFRHTEWTETSVPLLAHVSHIFLQDFEMKLVSDSGKIGEQSGSDIVYISDTDERFVNVKDDLSMRINSALTADECKRLGVPNSVKLSTPIDARTGDGILTVYDVAAAETAKAEQLYVDSYYKEWHAPRLVMEQSIFDTPAEASPFALFRHPAMPGRVFHVQASGRNLMEGSLALTLKEISEQ